MANKITNEEAIKRIHRFVETYKICGKDNYNPTTNITKLDYEAFKAAIESLEQQPCEDSVFKHLWAQVKWERDVAIEQLEQLGYSLGKKIRTGETCINQQDALEAISKVGLLKSDIKEVQAVAECLKAVEVIQPVTPQSKVGKWIINKEYNGYETVIKDCSCSICGEKALLKRSYSMDGQGIVLYPSNYCPNCGTKMVQEDSKLQESKDQINFAKDLIPIVDETESENTI